MRLGIGAICVLIAMLWVACSDDSEEGVTVLRPDKKDAGGTGDGDGDSGGGPPEPPDGGYTFNPSGDGDTGDGDMGDGDMGDGGMGTSEGGTGDGDGADGPEPAAPVIELLTPSPAVDPNADEVLTETTVRARCRVTKSTEPDARDVDQSSVRIELIDLSGQEPSISGSVNALTDNEFEAIFQLGQLPNGRLRFSCSAKDVGQPAASAEAHVDTFLDLGPAITILDPLDGGSYALKSPIVIRFEAKPAPVSGDDEQADPQGVELRVIDQVIAITEDPAQAGLFTASVDFDNRTLFPMRPTSADIVVRASSSRSPAAPVRSEMVNIAVDAEGPTIMVEDPVDTAIVRGQVQLVVKISDPAGVREDSVVGLINSGLYTLDSWTIDGNEYRAQFDTRATVFDNLTQLTINITVEDNVGNNSTAQHLLRLDNVPPLVSLDPPPIREFKLTTPGGGAEVMTCGEPFDPVGEDATNDLDEVLASSLYRVLAVDRTNGSAGANFVYYAGVDNDTVRLFAQGDVSIPLLVDTNSDGVCDEIQSDTLPLSERPVVLELAWVKPGGKSLYTSQADFEDPAHIADSDCRAAPNAPGLPKLICPAPATAMRRVIPVWYESKPLAPAIFALNPSNMASGACTGNSWELLGVLGSEGWACLAARAVDKIGNIGVSPPMRVCINDGVGPAPACSDPITNPPPSCTDGCTPPPNLARNVSVLER